MRRRHRKQTPEKEEVFSWRRRRRRSHSFIFVFSGPMGVPKKAFDGEVEDNVVLSRTFDIGRKILLKRMLLRWKGEQRSKKASFSYPSSSSLGTTLFSS